MTVVLLICACGVLSGFLLMTYVPVCEGTASAPSWTPFALIVPARNEEDNLPRLLGSVSRISQPFDLLVVDDNSTDRTSEIAHRFHARVIQPGEPPAGIKGKAWACARGAEQTSANLLFFLDADTWFEPNGAQCVLRAFARMPSSTALSVLPFAVTEHLYEELSLFFNLLMAFGAGGFGAFRPPCLFGQSLLLPKDLYILIGGHDSVGEFVLENFHLADRLNRAHGHCICLGGKGSLNMRMFPGGMKQLCDGWMKAFADGAESTNPRILLVSVIWLTALAASAAIIPFLSFPKLQAAGMLYLFAALQVFFFSRQIGTFRITTCLLFPLPLAFFFILFSLSTIRHATRRPTNWRGRNV